MERMGIPQLLPFNHAMAWQCCCLCGIFWEFKQDQMKVPACAHALQEIFPSFTFNILFYAKCPQTLIINLQKDIHETYRYKYIYIERCTHTHIYTYVISFIFSYFCENWSVLKNNKHAELEGYWLGRRFCGRHRERKIWDILSQHDTWIFFWKV